MPAVQAIVVEDEPFARSMIVAVLASFGIEAIALASAAEAVAHDAEDIDVAILDLDLGPGPSGIDVAYALRERQRDIGIVFLTSYSDPRVKDPAERLVPRGARFLVKSRLDDPRALRDAILDARRDPLRASDATDGTGPLTSHQLDVLRLLASGRSNAEIAEALDVGEKAVERTVQRILEALGIDRSSGNVRVLAARAYAELAGKAMPSA